MSMYHTFLIKYLPNEDLNKLCSESHKPDSLITSSHYLGFEAASELSNYIALYQQENNAVYLFSVLCLLHNRRVYPPEFIMNELHSVFKKWIDSGGKKSLDALFKIKKRGLGNRINRVIELNFIHQLMREIWQLKNVFLLSTEQATEMASRRLEEQGKKDKTAPVYTADTLRRYYDGKYGKCWRENTKEHLELFKKWTNENKTKFLSFYPKDSIPYELK